jgi:chromosome segregation ATPase
VAQLGTELGRASELGGRVSTAMADFELLDRSVEGLTERTCRLEESRPSIERAMRDLGALGATQEAIKTALEQLMTAREELTETRGRLENTRGWLGDTEKSVAALKNDVAGLDRMRSTVDNFRQEADQLATTMGVVESRKNLVEDVQRRLTEAAGLGASVEERARGLTDRLEAAEDHLGTLIPRLDEVGRAGSQLLSLGADLREMEQRVDGVRESMGGIEEHVKSLESLSERARELSRDMDQRQNALKRATEHLDRATELRQEAATVAQTLADRAREIDDALVQADERLAALAALSKDLETRTSVLQAVPGRIAGFEARLAEWGGVEQQLAQASEQAVARQASVAALQGEIRALFERVEQVQHDARAVAEAQPQIAKTRAALDDILARLDDSEGVMKTLVERRRQLDRAEERLAHADTLLSDLRSALEILLSQKAQVDYFLEQAGALSLEARQAESLLATLREERRVADRIRGALSELRKEDEPAS